MDNDKKKAQPTKLNMSFEEAMKRLSRTDKKEVEREKDKQKHPNK